MTETSYKVGDGYRFPVGLSVTEDGANFCIFSRHASQVELLLYENIHSQHPFQTIKLDSKKNHSFFYWHVFVEKLPAGTCYTWKMDGPKDRAETGRIFFPHKELLDPYALSVSNVGWNRQLACQTESSGGGLRAIVVDTPELAEPAAPDRSTGEWLNGAFIYEMIV